MKREIIFRGKRLDNGEWVVGNFVYKENEDGTWADNYIVSQSYDNREYKVHPATVGQYTGLKDRNGNRIFEGDVIAINGKGFGYVMWHYNGYFFLNDHFDEYMHDMETIGDFLEIKYVQTKGEIDYRIIGNIHDTKLEEMK